MAHPDAAFVAQVEHLRATFEEWFQGWFIIEELARLPSERPQADFLQRHFGAKIDGLTEVTSATAYLILHGLCRVSLAYRVEMMPPAQAQTFASQFLALFGPDALYWSNCNEPHTGRSWAWNSLTASTFDSGVLVVGTRYISVMWMEDED